MNFLWISLVKKIRKNCLVWISLNSISNLVQLNTMFADCCEFQWTKKKKNFRLSWVEDPIYQRRIEITNPILSISSKKSTKKNEYCNINFIWTYILTHSQFTICVQWICIFFCCFTNQNSIHIVTCLHSLHQLLIVVGHFTCQFVEIHRTEEIKKTINYPFDGINGWWICLRSGKFEWYHLWQRHRFVKKKNLNLLYDDVVYAVLKTITYKHTQYMITSSSVTTFKRRDKKNYKRNLHYQYIN
jgi:hypothetical protein